MGSVPSKVYVFKFRPSSHSDDFTLIATYKDEESALKVGEALKKLMEDMKEHESDYETDWDPNETTINVFKANSGLKFTPPDIWTTLNQF